MKLLITFIILSTFNVILSTIRSIVTIKSGKTIASLINGIYFAFYTVMLIYTVADFPLWQKCVVTFVCNVVGVWIVKDIEERMRKDKLWKVELTIKVKYYDTLKQMLENANIPTNMVLTSDCKYAICNIFCETQKQSCAVKEIAKSFEAKYFVSESKTL